jgi:hypothetical protein
VKKTFILIAALLGSFAGVRSANAAPADAWDSFQSQAELSAEAIQPTVSHWKPNQIVAGNISYDGIVVEMIRIDSLLQLFNPAAPAPYLSPEDNVVRDPISGRFSGWKILRITF